MIGIASILGFGLKHWRIIAIAVAVLSVWAWHKAQVSSAYREGVKSEQTRARIEAGKRIVEMEKNNETFRNLSSRDRCLAFLRDSGLPVGNNCD